MDRRRFLLSSLTGVAGVASAGSLLVPRSADASTSRMLTLEELTSLASFAVAGTPHERSSAWEDLPSGRRIVTYTRLTIDRAIAGAPPSEVRVRTLGGVVGKIGQVVAGEARLVADERSVLFLTAVRDFAVVTAMSQGHYPLVTDASGVARLSASPETDALLGRPGPVVFARDLLIGASVDDAAAAILKAAGGAK